MSDPIHAAPTDDGRVRVTSILGTLTIDPDTAHRLAAHLHTAADRAEDQ